MNNIIKYTTYVCMLALTVLAAGCGSNSNPAKPNNDLTITTISPSSAPAGETVTISGSGFSRTPANNSVTFSGGTQAKVTEATPSSLTVTVPDGAQNGAITVKVGSASATSQSFIVSAGVKIPEVYKNLPGNKTLIAQDETWSNDTTIAGPQYVLPGATLTVKAGVTVSFKYHNNNSDDVGTIITLPGTYDNYSDGYKPSGRLVARGTANNPIIFTSTKKQVASWGGIILAGNATNNNPGGQGEIEGLSKGVQYGINASKHSFINDDDSGVLSYVQINYSGYSISDGSELQGLTPYALGSKTQLDHICIFKSVDDGIEPFGGTENIKYLVVVDAQDDSFDGDAGWQGKGQFWLALQEGKSNRGFENDGCASGSNDQCSEGAGNSQFHIYNATVYTKGQSNGEKPMAGMFLREGLQGTYNNIILANSQKNTTAPIYIEDDATRSWIATKLTFGGIISYNNNNNDYTGLGYTASQLDVMQVNANEALFTDPSNYDFSLVEGSAGTTHHVGVPSDDFYTPTDFSGAVGVKGSENDWTSGAKWIKWQD